MPLHLASYIMWHAAEMALGLPPLLLALLVTAVDVLVVHPLKLNCPVSVSRSLLLG